MVNDQFALLYNFYSNSAGFEKVKPFLKQINSDSNKIWRVTATLHKEDMIKISRYHPYDLRDITVQKFRSTV